MKRENYNNLKHANDHNISIKRDTSNQMEHLIQVCIWYRKASAYPLSTSMFIYIYNPSYLHVYMSGIKALINENKKEGKNSCDHTYITQLTPLILELKLRWSKLRGDGSVEELLPRRGSHTLQVNIKRNTSLPQRLIQRIHHVLRRHVRGHALHRRRRVSVRRLEHAVQARCRPPVVLRHPTLHHVAVHDQHLELLFQQLLLLLQSCQPAGDLRFPPFELRLRVE